MANELRYGVGAWRQRVAAGALAAAGLCLLPVDRAEAQDCGNWNRPVLCAAALVLVDENYQRIGLNDRSGIALAPRESIVLELDARDQYGRRFPTERLAIGHDVGNCGRMLRIDDRGEGRFEISATATEGRCTLEIWVPNNLNFFWQIDFEIDAYAARSYDRAEAETITNALYAALLTREPDPSGFNSSIAEIQAGNLEGLIAAMLGSPEFRTVVAGKTPAQILEQFYQGILGREGDSAGVRLYLGEMRRGQYASVLLKLIRSPEFERRLG